MQLNANHGGSSEPLGANVPAIEVSNLNVDLGGARILKGLSLRVNQGEVVAILGANASGKSTLIRSLVRAIPIASGNVSVFGVPLGPAVPWDRVGYVPQRVGALSGVSATAREVVASGLLGVGRLRKPRGWIARTNFALSRVGLADRAQVPLHEMSGGQQQRVLIARALVRRPKLLFLDEPVAGVDLPSQLNFAENLKELTEQGVTVVVVLHELGDIANLITRTIVLDYGHIIHDGHFVAPESGHLTRGHVHAPCDPPVGASVMPDIFAERN